MALTDPGEFHAWAPFDPDRDLGKPGVATDSASTFLERIHHSAMPAFRRPSTYSSTSRAFRT